MTEHVTALWWRLVDLAEDCAMGLLIAAPAILILLVWGTR